MTTTNNNAKKMPEVVCDQRPFVADTSSRTMSIDGGSLESRLDHSSGRHGKDEDNLEMPTASTKVHAPYGSSIDYRQRYPYLNKRSEHLRSVVTSSFSMDDERDDMMRGYSHGPPNFSFEQRMDRNARRRGDDEREGWNGSSQVVYFAPSTSSPKNNRIPSRHYLHRTYSSSGYFVPTDTMKRSYYHHSMAMNPYQNPLPPEFMPPMKRTRHEPMRKEIYASPSEDGEPQQPIDQSGVQRTQSFPSRPLPPHTHVPLSPSGFPYHPRYLPPSPNNKYAQISPGSDVDESPRSWNGEMVWTPTPYGASTHFWESPQNGPRHAPIPSPKKSPPNHSPPSRPDAQQHHKPVVVHRSSGDEKMRMMVEAAAKANTELRESASNEESTTASKSYMLLSLPDDRMSLSETLCVVRENIEVFTASQADVDAPAPGRKHAVVVGQVGLRCIHCRHTIRNSDRVKRAVCYPSSIKRIYRTVIDMKLDHFTQCKFVPVSLKNHLNELKAVHTRSTGTTMLYFIKAAKSQGMEDGPSGVILGEGKDIKMTSPSTGTKTLTIQEPRDKTPSPPQEKVRNGIVTNKGSRAVVTRCDSLSSGSWTSGDLSQPPRIDSMASWSFESPSATGATSTNQYSPSSKPLTCDINFEGVIPLSLPEDKSSLSPLRCFLREQVCAFSATEKDIAVRAPTTFSITVGQVGIGCIHCVKQSARHRSNRAVCFPFSIGRIYQSVADIQRFHFGECHNMPDEVKYKFLDLQSASSKGSKGLATRQYWMSSARKIGLMDTPTGIRFGRDPTKPESTTSFSLDILAQVAFTVTTASKPLVLPEDKPCIAEFLYVVMEQLQPCRFTEADRNKRRLKDVGCIGVECKHCAGQVDSRKFFWSSVSAVESNFVSVHTHVLECKCVPAPLKERLLRLKALRKEQTSALRTGSQKSFFARVWQRLHETESMMDDDQTLPSSQFREIQKSASTSSSSTAASSPHSRLMIPMTPLSATKSNSAAPSAVASTPKLAPCMSAPKQEEIQTSVKEREPSHEVPVQLDIETQNGTIITNNCTSSSNNDDNTSRKEENGSDDKGDSTATSIATPTPTPTISTCFNAHHLSSEPVEI